MNNKKKIYYNNIMTSIDKFTFEDSDNEDTYHISGGDREALVYDIPKNIQFGGSDASIDPEADSELLSDSSIDPEADLEQLSDVSIDPEADLEQLSDVSIGPEIDLEQLSDASIDSEIDLNDNTNKLKSNIKSSNINVDNNIENESKELIENPDPYEELPDQEFIIDEEEFVIQEIKSKIKIFEEEVIPEHKVISNDKDQSEDLINEVIRLLPERMRSNKQELKKISKLLLNLQKLKEKFSIKDKNNLFKLKPKLKGKYYIKQIQNILDGDFSNNYLVPIVNAKNILHVGLPDYLEDDETILSNSLQESDLNDISKDNFIIKSNSEEIKESMALRDSFRKGKNRINYSFRNELNITHNNIEHYIQNTNNLNIRPKQNTFVFRDTFTQECFYYNKKKISTKDFTKFLAHADLKSNTDIEAPLFEGQDLDINGFIRLPRNNLLLKRLNIDNLHDVCKNKYSFNDLYNNISNNTIEHVNFNLELNKKVKLCFSIDNEKTILEGVIENIDEDTIFVRPIDLGLEEDLPNDILEIQKNDKNVKVLNIENGNRKCLLENENEYKIFLFDDEEIANKKILTKYLNSIIPNTNDIIYSLKEQFSKEENKSLDNLLEYISFYNLKLEDFNFENFKELIEILYNYNKSLSVQADEDEKKYLKFLKALPQQVRKNVLFINNKSLNNLKKYYGEYPFFGKSIDNAESRLRWLCSRPDNGMLYFKTIVKNITDKMKFDPEKMRQSTENKLYKLQEYKQKLDREIIIEKEKLINEKNPCLEFRIVKHYSSNNQLELDNETNVEIDKDKLIFGERTNIVQPGHYCILEEDSNNLKIFKRVKLANEKDIWTIQPELNVHQIMKSNKDFCEQQLKNLEDVESSMFNSESCKFSLLENNCVTASLDKKIQKREFLKSNIEDLEESIEQLRYTNDFTENIDKEIEKYKSYLLLINDLEYRKYKNMEKELEEENEDEIDPKYEELYNKINLFLQKISKFSDNKKYLLLENLVEKYGREYNSTNIIKENEHNIYCKFGNKVLCCKHDIQIINMFKSPDEFESNMEKLLENYGVENDGSYWCKNCGREIYIADYETLEGYKKSGARDVTNELIETEQYESKYENVELFESLKKYLDEDSKNESKLSIFNILKAFLNITGIKLNDSDEIRIMSQSTNLCKTNIKSKTNWLQTYKGKSKKADKYYENYVSVNTIFYTVSLLFITLQISIPEYVVKKQHAKCVVSLDGYPLNKNNNNGIEYFSCILETLRDSSSNFESLKKMKIQDTLEKTINKLVNDDFYELKYKEKNEYLLEQKKKKLNRKRKNVWNEFKPALEPFEIENNAFDKLLLQNLSKKKNKDELNLYYSLKVMSKIDYMVNDSNVENYLFNPTPLGNSCCIQNVNNSFDYYDYFSSDKSLKKLIEQSNDLDNNYYINNKSQITINTFDYNRLPSFKNKIYPDTDDITQEEISKLYEKFVSDLSNIHVGKRHAYESNICLLTGENRKDITQKTYSNEDYFKILNTINNKNRITLNNNENVIDNLVKVNNLIENNEFIKNDPYLTQFFNILNKTKDKVKIDELWGDFDQQIKVEINDFLSSFDQILTKPNIKVLNKILDNLGNLNKIIEERKERQENEISIEKYFYETKCDLIRKYTKYIFNILSKIKYDSLPLIININELPKNWKIEKSYYENLMINIKRDNEIVDRNIISKREKNLSIVFKDLDEIIKIYKELLEVSGHEHVYNCDKSINKYSKFTTKNCSAFLKYIMILLLKKITSLEESINIEISKLKLPHKTFTKERDDIDLFAQINTSSKSVSIDENNDILDDSEVSQNILLLENSRTDAQKYVSFLIEELLLNINDNQHFFDNHTQKHIYEVIEKTMDKEKEENLKFIEELDKESRQSLKSMITIGFETWKNLSKKSEKELYFGENIDQEANKENEALEIPHNEEEIEQINRNLAVETLGENFSEDQFREFVEDRQRNAIEEKQIQEDMDNMVDDDGDGEFGFEDEHEY